MVKNLIAVWREVALFDVDCLVAKFGLGRVLEFFLGGHSLGRCVCDRNIGDNVCLITACACEREVSLVIV